MAAEPSRLERREFLKRGATFLTLAGHARQAPVLASSQAGRPETNPDVLRKWATTIRGRVILPNDDAYESARRVWNLAIDRRPAAIVQCVDASDVVRGIEFARQQSLPLAVRSGGHSQAGFSTCDQGLILDLGQLKHISVDPTKRVARVGAGTRVSELHKGLQPHSVVTPSGGCPDVAVGGLTLGGGENSLMATYGVVCDNVLAADVVMSDGRTLRASRDENADLFWAIRGGGGNFGIVTTFEYRVYPAPVLVAGVMLFPIKDAAAVLSRYRDLMAAPPDALSTSAGLVPGRQGAILLIAFTHCGPTSDGERLATQWRSALKPMTDTIRQTSYTADFVMPAIASVGTGAFLPELSDEVIAIVAKQFVAAPAGSVAVWNDYHGAVTRVGVEEMAFPLRQRGYDLFMSAVWQHPAERTVATRWVDDTRLALAPHTRGLYVNNLGAEASQRVREVYAANYDRLVALKVTFDPANLFRFNANIVPTRV